jgi:transposase-like protein
MAKRRYTDEQRGNALAALAANGGYLRRTARQLKLPTETLRHWARQERHPEATEDGTLKKGQLADAFEAIAWKVLELLPGKLAQANAVQLATVAGVCIDKMHLLRGQPTQISQHDLSRLTDAELEAELAATQKALGQFEADTTEES